MGGEESLEGQEIVPLDNQVAVEPRFLPLAQHRELAIKLKRVVWNGVVIALDGGLSLELQYWHVSTLARMSSYYDSPGDSRRETQRRYWSAGRIALPNASLPSKLMRVRLARHRA